MTRNMVTRGHAAGSNLAAMGLARPARKLLGTDDTGTLLQAIADRLSQLADAAIPPGGDAAVPTRQGALLECVEALCGLRQSCLQQGQQQAGLRAHAALLQAALAQARRELASARANHAQAQHLALHDGLTSLPNRSYFRQRLDRALSHSQHLAPGLAVLYVDLDGMKRINDTHGHCVGDQVLQVVASRLKHTVREGDMVSRQGGDEFALLLANLPGRDAAGQLAHKLLQAVAAPLDVGGLLLQVQASIGIAVSPNDGDCANELMERADAAMYIAKRQHCGFTYFAGQPGSGG